MRNMFCNTRVFFFILTLIALPHLNSYAEPSTKLNIEMTEVTVSDCVDFLQTKFEIKVSLEKNWEDTFDIDFRGIDQESAGKFLVLVADKVNAIVEKNEGIYEVRSPTAADEEELFETEYVFTHRSSNKKDPWFDDIRFRPFLPKTRYYFDTGEDDEGELDIFQDGGLTPAVDFINIYYPINHERLGLSRFMGEDWLFGPSFGLGITTPSDRGEGDEQSSAPVVVLSAAFELDIPIGNQMLAGKIIDKNYITAEVGFMYGVTTDESIENKDDTAIFVGLGYSWKQNRIKKK